jgi:AcrR family transcriptional regulator
MLFDMGNREALLEGAKRCLLEKGYSRTTARDIADAAGVSLAAIGYHYGSKESLLEQAFMAAMEEWFDDEKQEAHQEPAGGSIERFRAFFADVIASFPEQKRLLRLNIEMGLETENNSSLATFMSYAVQLGREGLAENPGGLDPKRDGELAQQVGAFYSVLMTGIVAQYLMDRERFPSADDLTEGLRYIVERAHNA